MAILKAIVAVDKDWAIGKDNKLLYRIPEDMEFFKETTINKTVVMGHKTFVSMNSRSLPKRRNIILTRNYDKCRSTYKRIFMDCDHFDRVIENDKTNNVYFIIGGEEIYKRYYRQCSEIFVTMIDDEAKDPDKYFPDLNYCKEFRLDKVISTGEYKGLKFKITKWININK